MSVNQEAKAILKKLERDGWKISKTGKSHFRLQAPNGALVFHSCTSSDHRAVHNLRSNIKRALREEPRR